MTIAYVCVLIAVFIPLVFAGYAKFASGGYDNRAPRDFLEKLEGKPRRAHYVQMNSYEVFPPFAAAVIIAHYAAAAQTHINIFAVLFIIFRVIYGIAYVADQPTLRTLMWFGAFACTIGLFIISF